MRAQDSRANVGRGEKVGWVVRGCGRPEQWHDDGTNAVVRRRRRRDVFVVVETFDRTLLMTLCRVRRHAHRLCVCVCVCGLRGVFAGCSVHVKTVYLRLKLAEAARSCLSGAGVCLYRWCVCVWECVCLSVLVT